ncbi:radical SAM protein [Streptomyces sp. NPDC088354]|uniref:radical SAM protein n=1 Tax=unclassified Streptomyces TaxID=2593676 RepID=UPI0029A1B339|nr:radical SAM protein [Streptomyces sp. MI02-7b]MDX3074017.1 radical SAM protein [Streptomyces sp. MI02-7b]
MHLLEIGARRSIAAAGVYLALTRRCPLSCAHCSTDSSLSSEQHSELPFRRLVDSFDPQTRPDLLLMSGGEALLRARLVGDLARAARAVGTRSYVLSGMWFAREGRRLPAAVAAAAREVDHFAASLDEFHEREVSRAEVFRAMHLIRDIVPGVSFQITGRNDDDPYLTGLIADVRREFDDQVPILVGTLSAIGRGRGLAGLTPTPTSGQPVAAVDPCDRVTWPLVTYDGTVYACCNQDLVERRQPEHLILGHAARQSWPELRELLLEREMFRALRALGPSYVAGRFSEAACDKGMCGNCVGLAGDREAEQRLTAYLRTDSGRLLERTAREVVERQDATAFSSRRSRHGGLVALGSEEDHGTPAHAR